MNIMLRAVSAVLVDAVKMYRVVRKPVTSRNPVPKKDPADQTKNHIPVSPSSVVEMAEISKLLIGLAHDNFVSLPHISPKMIHDLARRGYIVDYDVRTLTFIIRGKK